MQELGIQLTWKRILSPSWPRLIDRRWEQVEDISLVEFTSIEYQSSKKLVANEAIKEDIRMFGIRRLEG